MANLERLLNELDLRSRNAISHLLEHRHARLDELTEIFGESSDMNSLMRIKDVINARALKILRKPILVFEKLHIDVQTGEKVLFSWWLTEKRSEEAKISVGLLVDVFEEAKETVIIVGLPGVQEEDIKIDVQEKTLNILFKDREGIEQGEEINLPRRVCTSEFSRKFQNQMLTIKIPKNEI